MKNLDYVTNAFQYVLTVTQTKEVFQIISLVLSIITTVVIMGSKLIKWWKDAKQDGKITKEELEDATKIITDGIEDIKDKTNGK